MKIYKYIGVALMVLSLGACKTDDLERDIDALKDRVTAMEAKVDRLNESMNMIRVALDGNKTIQCYTENEDGSYTLTKYNHADSGGNRSYGCVSGSEYFY